MSQLTYRIQTFHIFKEGDDVRICGVRRSRTHAPGVPGPRGARRPGGRCPADRTLARASGPAGDLLTWPAAAAALRGSSPVGRDQRGSVHAVGPRHRERRRSGRGRGTGAGGDAGGRGLRAGARCRARHRSRGRQQQQPLRRRRLLERPARGGRLPDGPHLDHRSGRGPARRNREGPGHEPPDPRSPERGGVAADGRPRHQQRRLRQGDRRPERGQAHPGGTGPGSPPGPASRGTSRCRRRRPWRPRSGRRRPGRSGPPIPWPRPRDP